ncbi:H-type lectin domain-containing protein [Ketogulonicigenium vulgare]|nr:H-type lectin domain-containing protein [Ketogulonicigenium vulgare]
MNASSLDKIESAPVRKFIRPALPQTGRIDLFNHYPDGPMWAGDGNRSLEVRVSFDRLYAYKPEVLLSLAAVDSAREQNLRYDLRVKDVDTNGFTIHFATWSDTRISLATVSWFAFGTAQ